MSKIFLSIVLLLSINGCVTDSSATHETGHSINLKGGADPEADALAALDKRDFRFMAISLRGTVIPGVDGEKSLQYKLRCGVKYMSGVSDAMHSQQELAKVQEIIDYATKYNAVIKTRCFP
ncbi:MAG: hypothetical protein GY744_05520 [Gammaproteobacteria bacterium]|nr:hypothetical protein [Gammaproteobacteria bacterium]